MSELFDAVVVGAGAAGLAAAAELAARGCSVCLLEARDRLGGRIWTRTEPHSGLPLELGAEFIHGRAEATFAYLAGADAAVALGRHSRWNVRDGRLEPTDDAYAELQHALALAGRPPQDIPFARFLAGIGSDVLPESARSLALRLIEGFDAADPDRVSAFEVLDEWRGGSGADAPTFRPRGGYRKLLESLEARLEAGRVRVSLGARVAQIRWKRSDVTVSGIARQQPFTVRAARAVVAVPLSVLKLRPGVPGAVRWLPDIAAVREALSPLHTGPALKVLLRFATAFWEHLEDGRYRDAGFFHADAAPFPTCWSALPLRAPVLTAWAAGPKARRLCGAPRGDIVRAALTSLNALFGEHPAPEAVYVHDWQSDPFARGAYSYAGVGGAPARTALARPIEGTLFLAGEALDTEGQSGTVAGALQSGRRAARQLCASGP